MSYIKTEKSKKFEVSTVLEEQLLYQGSWSNLLKFSYEDEKKQKRKWEGLHRKNDAEAVIIIAKMEPSDRYILFVNLDLLQIHTCWNFLRGLLIEERLVNKLRFVNF